MGVHELTCGLNGSGKSLLTVATKLAPLAGQKMAYETAAGQKREAFVRLVVGGIRDLMVAHELMEVPEIDAESFVDEWGTVKREPGQAAVTHVVRQGSAWVAAQETDTGAEPVVVSVLNWWVWCMPGDVITVDECQRVFRPMASGRRVPKFISKLETARHYGVRFQYITPGPHLVHANVRALVGPIEEVSRIFGSSRVLIRQWDRMADFGKKAMATTRYWKHDKKAFQLYKSAELHTKFGARIPLAVWAVGLGVVLLVTIGLFLKQRLQAQFYGTPATSASAPAGSAPTARSGEPQGAKPGTRFPFYEAVPVVADREPFSGRAVQLEGSYRVGSSSYAVFGLLVDGERVATASLAQLVRMGYTWVDVGPCAGLLRFKGVERVITCGKASAVPSDRDRHQAASSEQMAASAPL